MYTVDYFINKFKAIPDSMWHNGDFVDPEFDGKQAEAPKCAMGHCNEFDINDDDWFCHNPEANALETLFLGTLGYSVMLINDASFEDMPQHGWHRGFMKEVFPQTTPKGRVLAALELIKEIQAMEEPKVKEKERIVYVAVPEKVTKQVKKMVKCLN